VEVSYASCVNIGSACLQDSLSQLLMFSSMNTVYIEEILHQKHIYIHAISKQVAKRNRLKSQEQSVPSIETKD